MAFWTRITSLIAGGAVARASADAATPVLEPVRQHAWSRNQLRVLDPGTVARLVAQAIVSEPEAEGEASRNGFNPNRLQALVHLAQVAPGLADARSLRRRKVITVDDLHHVYAKAQIEPAFWGDLDVLLGVLLSPAEVANAVQQGHLPNPGILPDVSAAVEPAQGYVVATAPDEQPPSHVPLTQIDLDPIEQAEGSGTSLDQLKVLANLSGLPPGAAELLTMWNRNLIDEESVDAGIREGHMKTKWAGAFKRLRWNVLGASEYANAYLRAWIDQEQMYKGGALTGHTTDQMDLMFKNRGRPLAPVQAFTAWARKAPHPVIPGEPTRPGTFDYTDFEQAIRRSDVQTWYAPVLWAIRYAYPSLFITNRLATAGTITPDQAALWLENQRYAPEVIDALRASWGGGTTAKADPHIAKAETQLWTTTHRSYVGELVDDATATTALAAAGVASAAVPDVLRLWTAERDLIRRQLSPTQIRKAYRDTVTNPATGQPWTFDDAYNRLIALGYGHDDATTFLGE